MNRKDIYISYPRHLHGTKTLRKFMSKVKCICNSLNTGYKNFGALKGTSQKLGFKLFSQAIESKMIIILHEMENIDDYQYVEINSCLLTKIKAYALDSMTGEANVVIGCIRNFGNKREKYGRLVFNKNKKNSRIVRI